MDYIWFNLVLEALGKRINYDSISNLYGNSFAKDAAKVIQAANPLIKINTGHNSAQTLLAMPGKTTIIRENKDKNNAQMNDFLGDMSWILKKGGK